MIEPRHDPVSTVYTRNNLSLPTSSVYTPHNCACVAPWWHTSYCYRPRPIMQCITCDVQLDLLYTRHWSFRRSLWNDLHSSLSWLRPTHKSSQRFSRIFPRHSDISLEHTCTVLKRVETCFQDVCISTSTDCGTTTSHATAFPNKPQNQLCEGILNWVRTPLTNQAQTWLGNTKQSLNWRFTEMESLDGQSCGHTSSPLGNWMAPLLTTVHTFKYCLRTRSMSPSISTGMSLAIPYQCMPPMAAMAAKAEAASKISLKTQTRNASSLTYGKAILKKSVLLLPVLTELTTNRRSLVKELPKSIR